MAQEMRTSAKGGTAQPRMSREEIIAARQKAEQLVEQIAGWLERFPLEKVLSSKQGGVVVAELRSTPTAWEVAHRFAVRLGGRYLTVPCIFYPQSQGNLIVKVLGALAEAGYQPTPYNYFRWWTRQDRRDEDSAERFLRTPVVWEKIEGALNGFVPSKPRTPAEMRDFDEEARFLNFLKRCKPREGKPTAPAVPPANLDLNDLSGGLDEPPPADLEPDLGEADLEEELPPLTDPDLEEGDLEPELKADPIAAIRELAKTDPTAVVVMKNLNAGKIDGEKAIAYARANRLEGFAPGQKFGKKK